MPGADGNYPTKQALATDLSKVARKGVWRSLPMHRSVEAIPHLWDASKELAMGTTADVVGVVAQTVVTATRGITPFTDRLAIAEMLWIDLDEPTGKRGGPVPQLELDEGRYELAAAQVDPPTTEGHFKNHLRRPLLEKVGEEIQHLLRQSRNAPPTDDPRPKYGDINFPLNEIADNAINLYYSAISWQFVAEFHKHIEDGTANAQYYPWSLLVWVAWAKRFYSRYMRFATDFGSLEERRFREDRSRGISIELTSRVDALCHACIQCGPPGLGDLSQAELYGMFPFVDPDVDEEFEKRLNDLWIPWLEPAFPLREDDPYDAVTGQSIDRMAARAFAVHRLIAKHVKLAEPYEAIARQQAYKDIEYSYFFTEGRTFHAGRYLREHIDLHFERREAQLDDSSLVWFAES